MNRHSHIKHLSLGEVLRQLIQDPNHPIAQKYETLIQSGALLPDPVIAELLDHELNQYKESDYVILLDGYPRTEAQYDYFKQHWGKPDALIHLDVETHQLEERLSERNSNRLDDNYAAIEKRLDFYQQTTRPMIQNIKKDLGKSAITSLTQASINATNLYLYSRLQSIPSIHEILPLEEKPKTTLNIQRKTQALWASSVVYSLWNNPTEYAAIAQLQQTYQTRNFSCSVLGTHIAYLETPKEVTKILTANSSLGWVYKHFSSSAGLKHEFVAQDVHSTNSHWKLIHNAMGGALKSDISRIKSLIDKHVINSLLAEKTFDLDSAFDHFFISFWTDYLFGTKVAVNDYQETRQQVLEAMQHCFYNNTYKAFDPTGLSSYFSSFAVGPSLHQARERMKHFIHQASTDSLIKRFDKAITQQNEREQLGLSAEEIEEMVLDNAFDFFFVPDFLENILYETLVSTIKEHADLHEENARKHVYEQGRERGYLFPIRSRILEESVILEDGTLLPQGSLVYLNLKQAGLYHSTGPRRCIGQAYAHAFETHFFDCLQSLEFNVKSVSEPKERLDASKNPNIPTSPERLQVSWKLRREEGMRYLPSHAYKGNTFFDVLSLHEHPLLNAQMLQQMQLKITRFMEKNKIEAKDVVLATPEVRGIPIASQIAARLNLPLCVIRKKGGYKMDSEDLCFETYSKGYKDTDTLELPKEKIKALSGKTVILLDDGLASGQSALTCINLLEQRLNTNPAKVAMVYSLLKHDYTEITPKLSEHCLVKTLFDCRTKSQGHEPLIRADFLRT
jgi:adenylate kinase family enzyme/adenine/guanine phosphoribosyltransferase-like PRPP-binding protein